MYSRNWKIAYEREKLKLQVEIASITNRKAMARIFEQYHPQIVINAAAHKHVPLMEHNCIEAIGKQYIWKEKHGGIMRRIWCRTIYDGIYG